METEKEKYNKVINILKKSRPVLDSTEEIEAEVVGKILKSQQSSFLLSDMIGFIFGWIYIEWVRRSLIAASVVLVMIFIYQQGIIIKQVNFLSRQMIVTEGKNVSNLRGELEKRLIIYKLSGRRLPSQTITISEKDLQQLLESVNELEDKYKDLQNLIENDPELKKYFEKRLNENNQTKINL